jgi:hypothetical protein
MELPDRIAGLPKHCFRPGDLPLGAAIAAGQLPAGHRHITDAYLVGLAAQAGKAGRLRRAREAAAVFVSVADRGRAMGRIVL